MTPRRRRLLHGIVTVTGGLVVLHTVQAAVGHAAFAIVGPLVGGFMAGGVWFRWLRGRLPTAVATSLATALFVLLVVPEWVEGEFALGHEPDVFGHALPATATVGAALLVFAALEARRTFALLRDAFD